jgi:hypothetical protein
MKLFVNRSATFVLLQTPGSGRREVGGSLDGDIRPTEQL